MDAVDAEHASELGLDSGCFEPAPYLQVSSLDDHRVLNVKEARRAPYLLKTSVPEGVVDDDVQYLPHRVLAFVDFARLSNVHFNTRILIDHDRVRLASEETAPVHRLIDFSQGPDALARFIEWTESDLHFAALRFDDARDKVGVPELHWVNLYVVLAYLERGTQFQSELITTDVNHLCSFRVLL